MRPYGRSNTSEVIPPRGVVGSQDKGGVAAGGNGSNPNFKLGSAKYSYYYNLQRFALTNPEYTFTELRVVTSNSSTSGWDLAGTFDFLAAEQAPPGPDMPSGGAIITLLDTVTLPFVPWIAGNPSNPYSFGALAEGIAGKDRVGGGTGTNGNVISPPQVVFPAWPGQEGIILSGPDTWDVPPGDYAGPMHADVPDTIGLQIGENLLFEDPGITQITIPPGWLYSATTEVEFLAMRLISSPIGDIQGPVAQLLIWTGGVFPGVTSNLIDTYLPSDFYVASGVGSHIDKRIPAKRYPAANEWLTILTPFADVVGPFWGQVPVQRQTVTVNARGYSGSGGLNINDIVVHGVATGSPPGIVGSTHIFPVRVTFSVSGMYMPASLFSQGVPPIFPVI